MNEEVIIKKITSPSNFYGIHCINTQINKFNKLKNEINSYFGDERMFKALLTNPSEGMRCIVRSETSMWDRARVEVLMIAPKTYKARCFLVDKLESILVPVNRLYVSPEWAWKVPSRGAKLGLYGILPIALHTDYVKNQVKRRVGQMWSTAAIEFFQNEVLRDGSYCCIETVKKDDDGTLLVRLFVQYPGMQFSVSMNDLLVKRKFAFSIEEDTNGFKKRNSGKEAAAMNETHISLSDVNSKVSYVPNIETPYIGNDSDIFVSPTTSTPEKKLTSPKAYLNGFDNENFSSIPQEVSDEGIKKQSPSHLLVPFFAKNNDIDLDNESSGDRNFFGKNSPFQTVSPLRKKFAGRGKMLSSLIGEHLQKCSANPPTIQRKVVNGDISAFSLEFPPENKCVTTKNENDTVTIFNLVKRIKSFNIDRMSSAKLNDILSMTDQEPSPGRLSITAKKILLLEKLLSQVKERTFNFQPIPALSGSNLPKKEEAGALSLRKIEGSAEPVLKKSTRRSNEKNNITDDGFFSSAVVLNNSQNNSSMLLVKGVDPPNPFSLFCETPFPSFLISAMEKLRYRGPYALQAHVWPAILNKRNIVALGPSGVGKTLAYVAPIVSMLTTKTRDTVEKSTLNRAQAIYMSGRNPSVIVLCSTWRNVEAVVHHFETFLKQPNESQFQAHRVIGISGGPEIEQSSSTSLLSGSSVLVCSPCTFLRLCQLKQLSLTRLEQLALDDFHILVEEFTSQLREIITIWSAALNHPDRPVDMMGKTQILCFGIQWTDGVENFVKELISKPLLYISDPLEASVFGQVDQRLEMLKHFFRYDRLVNIINTIQNECEGGIAVHVVDVKTMKELSSSLQKNGFSTFEAYSNMDDCNLQMLQQSYDEPSTAPILVICDNALTLVDIDMIEISIHYDFPPDERILGLRMSLMRSFFKIKKANTQIIVNPRSYLLFTDKDCNSSLWISKFLSRLSKPIPPLLKESVKLLIESQEISKVNYKLCPFLQAYGRCRDVKVCKYRHWLCPKVDLPNSSPLYPKVPTSGHVQVHITNVKNATFYYGRLIKYKSTDQSKPLTTYADVYKEITERLDTAYNQQRLNLEKLPHLGQLCGLKSFGQYHRVRVVSTPTNRFKNEKTVCWKTQAGVTKVRVHLIDTGAFQAVNINDLLQLPQDIAKIPFQAIEVRSCNVIPIDQDIEWLFSANKLVHDLIFDKVIEGNIMFALNHTIWLQPVVIRSKLPTTGIYITECDVVKELLNSGLAERFSSQLTNLRGLMGEGSLPIEVWNKKQPTKFNDVDSRPDLNRNKQFFSNLSENKTIKSISVPNTHYQKENKTVERQNHQDNFARKTAEKIFNKTVSSEKRVSKMNVEQSLQKFGSREHSRATSQSQLNNSLHHLHQRSNLRHTPSRHSVLTSGYDTATFDGDCRIEKFHDGVWRKESPKQPVVKKHRRYSCSKTDRSPRREPDSTSSSSSSEEYYLSPTTNLTDLTPTNSNRSKSSSIPKASPVHDLEKTPVNYCSIPHNPDQRKINSSRSSSKSPFRKSFESKCVSKVIENLPPFDDIHGDGVIYPYYVQLAHLDNVTTRLDACEQIYIQASENYSSVSKLDLESLGKAFQYARNSRETLLLTYTLISLAKGFVPVEDHINLPELFRSLCINNELKNVDVPTVLVVLCMMRLDNLIKEHNEQLSDLTDVLVTYVESLIFSNPTDEKTLSVIKSILNLLEIIANEARNKFVTGDRDRLINILFRLEPSEQIDEVRNRLYDFIRSDRIPINEVNEVAAASSTREISVEKKEADRKPAAPKKVYDRLNYDRFNCIDTSDSEMSSSSRPYTPIPCKFDSETDTVFSETSYDSDFHPGLY